MPRSSRALATPLAFLLPLALLISVAAAQNSPMESPPLPVTPDPFPIEAHDPEADPGSAASGEAADTAPPPAAESEREIAAQSDTSAPADTPAPMPTAPSLPTATATPRPSSLATTAPTRAPTVLLEVPAGIAEDARRLEEAAAAVDRAAGSGDWAAARQRWRDFDDLWFAVEDPFRSAFPQRYRAIEDAMSGVKYALRPDVPSREEVQREVANLRAQLQPLLPAGGATATPERPDAAQGAGTPAQRTAQATATAALLTGRHLATPTAAPTPIPASCLTPSLRLSASSLNNEGYLEWQAQGFKPGTVVEINVLGPNPVGQITGPLILHIEGQVVGSRCEVIVEPAEAVKGEELLEHGAPSGHYVLQVEGIRYARPGVQEERIRTFAPFTYSIVYRPGTLPATLEGPPPGEEPGERARRGLSARPTPRPVR